MDPAAFDQLEQTLKSGGASAAIEHLCASLQQNGDYANLFYALLLKNRHKLGVSPVPTDPAHLLPEAVHGQYEDAIREAARTVGQLYLDQGDIPRAWGYFRMIGEPGPVRQAIEKYQPTEGEEGQQVIEIAFHHGVEPRKGFDWLLARYGMCSAITTVSSQEFGDPEIRVYCIAALVRALYEQLRERLAEEIARKEGSAPSGRVADLMSGRDWLFDDESYHVDVSHL